MAEPNMKLYIETAGGTQTYADNSANYTELVLNGTSTFWWTGPDTNSSTLDPVNLPGTGIKIAEELWVDVNAESPSKYTQVPNYGTHTKQYEVCVLFADNECVARPRLEAWDDLVDLQGLVNPNNEILIGTTETSNKSFIRAYDSTSGVPASADWYKSATQAADSNNNKCLQGSASYLEAQGDKGANSYWYLKLACVVPVDAGIGIASHGFILVVRYFWV